MNRGIQEAGHPLMRYLQFHHLEARCALLVFKMFWLSNKVVSISLWVEIIKSFIKVLDDVYNNYNSVYQSIIAIGYHLPEFPGSHDSQNHALNRILHSAYRFGPPPTESEHGPFTFNFSSLI